MEHLRRFVPLTPAGLVVSGVGLLSYVVGWRLGWIELMVVAAGCLAALLLALPFVVGRARLTVERSLEPARVVVGEPSLAVLTVRNDAPRRSAPRLVEDRVGDRRMHVEVPSLASGDTHEAVYNLPTDRRGAYAVGPAVIVKADPLDLMRREIAQSRPATLFVHPRYRAVSALPVGFAKDLEGPTSDTSPQGDVAFHALREYQVGDDYRHIHWLSTARAGAVMVRHYVDNRRPHLGVMLDDTLSVYRDPQAYETAVEVAASLAVSSLVHRQPVAVYHGSRPVVGRSAPATTDDVLDRLAVVTPDDGSPRPEAVQAVVGNEPGVSAVAIVTGDVGSADLLAAAQPARSVGKVLIVRVGASDRGAVVPRARVLDVTSLEEFAVGWNRVAT